MQQKLTFLYTSLRLCTCFIYEKTCDRYKNSIQFKPKKKQQQQHAISSKFNILKQIKTRGGKKKHNLMTISNYTKVDKSRSLNIIIHSNTSSFISLINTLNTTLSELNTNSPSVHFARLGQCNRELDSTLDTDNILQSGDSLGHLATLCATSTQLTKVTITPRPYHTCTHTCTYTNSRQTHTLNSLQ